MNIIVFAWVCRNKHFNTIERVELSDRMLLDGSYPSWITSDNCEVLAKIRPTGLHDKSGKEIYEGDVVQCSFADGASKRGEISFVDGCFDVCFYQHRDYLKCFVVNHAIEIIGNIFQNPELLKEQNDLPFYNATHNINELPNIRRPILTIEGMTKREIFAKDLTAALMSNPYLTKLYIESGGAISELATDAGIIAADALIKKLNEGKEENKND